MAIRDDGVGGADLGSGSGLQGLRDRVAALNGTLEIDSPPGEGTRLRARLPVRYRYFPASRGWAIVGALSVTEIVSWGVLYYAFAVFLVPMQRELGFSQPS